MMTFKDLKKLVELPLYKEQRVPTVKALEVSGVPVVAEKILENHGSISVYQNGYVIYRAHKRVTVFSLRNCVHEKTIDEQRFVMMVSDQKPDLLPSIVVQSDGKFMTTAFSGFDALPQYLI